MTRILAQTHVFNGTLMNQAYTTLNEGSPKTKSTISIYDEYIFLYISIYDEYIFLPVGVESRDGSNLFKILLEPPK